MREQPVSPAQETLFYLAQQATDPSHRLAQLSVSFGEVVPVALLRQTWSKLASTHGVLRSSFRKSHGKPLIRTEHDGAETPWRELDWSDVPPTDLPERWASALSDEASRPIDPQSPPPIRFLAIILPGGTTHLLATYPRLLLDEESWFFLLCEWLEALEGKVPIQGEHQAGQSSVRLDWWKEHLSGLGPQQVRYFGGQASPNEQHNLFDRDTTESLGEACRRCEATPRDAVLAAWALLVSRLALEPKPLVLSTVDSPNESPEDLGPQLNHLPCALPVREDQSLAAFVRSVAGLEKARRAAAGTSLESLPLPEGLHAEADNFAAAFGWLPPSLRDRVPDVFPRWINLDARIIDHPMHPLEFEARDGARLALRIRASSLPPSEVSRLLSTVEQILRTLVSSPETRLREIEIPGTPSAPTRDGEPSVQPAPIHEIIVDAVDTSPDRNAIEDADGAVLTFREVEDYACSLAAYLRNAHLGEGWTIAICLANSPWVPVAILGTLKAGDTCAMLDSEASKDWIARQLVATDTELVICDSSTKELFEGSEKKLLVIDREWDQVAAATAPEGDPEKPAVAIVFAGTESLPPPPLPRLSPSLLSSACTRTIQIAEIESGDRVVVSAPAGTPSFASSILSSLAAGATAVFSREAISVLEPTFFNLSALEFSSWMATLQRTGGTVPESLRCVAVDARLSAVSPKAFKIWQDANKSQCRWISFLSPCDIPGFGLQFVSPELPDSVEPLDDIPLGRPLRGAGFRFENLVGGQPPFGYPGLASFHPAGTQHPCCQFPAWRDAHGLLHRIPNKTDETLSALCLAKGVVDAAWDPENPDTAWIVTAEKISEKEIHDSLSSFLPEPPARLFCVEEIPLRHGVPDFAALCETHLPAAIPEEPPAPEEVEPPTEIPQPAPAPTRPRALKPLGGGPEAPLLIVLDEEQVQEGELIALLGTDWCLATVPWVVNPSEPAEASAKIVSAILAEAGDADIHLLGLRKAGLVAMETARKLRDAGREVPYLVIVGTPPPAVAKSNWLGTLKRKLGADKAGHTGPLDGPCGILLTRDLPADAESQWLEATVDAVIEKLPCSSKDLTHKAARLLAEAMKRLGA